MRSFVCRKPSGHFKHFNIEKAAARLHKMIEETAHRPKIAA
jgi:hypothetical protein